MKFLLFARIGFLWTALKETVMGELPTVRLERFTAPSMNGSIQWTTPRNEGTMT